MLKNRTDLPDTKLVKPSMLIVLNNKTIYMPRQINNAEFRSDDLIENKNDNINAEEVAAKEELLVRDILTNLELLKEQERLALADELDLQELDSSVKVILVDKKKDKEIMDQIKGLEEAEMILMDDENNDNTRFSPTRKPKRQKGSRWHNRKRKRRHRRQRVKLQREENGDKVQKIYVTY